jgi:hypothetical protein
VSVSDVFKREHFTEVGDWHLKSDLAEAIAVTANNVLFDLEQAAPTPAPSEFDSFEQSARWAREFTLREDPVVRGLVQVLENFRNAYSPTWNLTSTINGSLEWQCELALAAYEKEVKSGGEA